MLLTVLADAPINDIATQQSMSFFDLLMKGGVVIIPILLLSLITVFIFSEKLFYIHKCTRVKKGFAQSLLTELAKGKENALTYCKKSNTSIGRIFGHGVEIADKPVKDVEGIMESAANVEVAHMERSVGYLGIIAGIAPMLGFIGTISGVIKIFYNISLTDNISIGIIAGGLYQKMVSSGTGLIVGVIAYSCYHYLHMQIDKFSTKLQEETFVFIKSIQK